MEGETWRKSQSSILMVPIMYYIASLLFTLFWNSYEDWGVDELIVEDSWKRQVGGG
jgi:hypothetical protein